MKLFQITAIAMVLVAALMTGCRNRTDTTMPSGSTGAPSSTAPQQTTRPSTAPSTAPMPSTSMPQGTDTTPATNGTDGILDPGTGSSYNGMTGGMQY